MTSPLPSLAAVCHARAQVDTASKNHRRTGRFTSKDFVSFSAAEQVFQGSGDDDQVYTVQPFRVAGWPAGQYYATAMFYAQDEAQGWVRAPFGPATQ